MIIKASPALVVPLWIVALTAIATTFVLESFHRQTQLEFDSQAQLRVDALQRSLDEKLLILQSMHSLFAIFGGHPQPNFRAFVEPFETGVSGVQALQWVVPVPERERTSFEQSVRDAGIPAYEITERDATGAMISAGRRELYFPVYPLLPLDPNEASFGFDIASSPQRKLAIDRAIAGRTMAASQPLDLLQGNAAGTKGVLVMMPLFADAAASTSEPALPLGLVLGVFQIDSIIDDVLAKFPDDDLWLELWDDAAAPFHTTAPTPSDATLSWFGRWLAPAPYKSELRVADRLWRLDALPGAQYMATRQHFTVWITLVGGLLLALVTRSYLWLSVRHQARIQTAQHQREELEHQLLRSQRMEMIGQLVGGIAHDFKNLLGTIIGNADLLDMELEERGLSNDRHVRHITQAAERGNKLIRKMLDFSRSEPTIPSRQSLAPLLESTLAMLRPLIPATILLDTRIDGPLPDVTIDPIGFDQILVNLCVNARDAIQQNGHGRIGVSLKRVADAAGICASCQASVAGEYVELAVSDDGSGIAPALQPDLFKPFFTTKADHEGTGLGLPIVHNVTHGCGGHILLESTVGAGTRFRILFPIEPHG